MPRMPLSEAGGKWMLIALPIVFALVWLFNAYRLGRLTYNVQLIVSVITVLAANILTTLFKHWAWRSGGFALCGFLWIIHPVLPEHANVKNATLWIRLAGVLLILIGIFTRVH